VYVGASRLGTRRAASRLADRVHLVAEELDADGVAAHEGEHVEDAAAEGDLAGVGHELDRLEPLPDEPVHQRLGRRLVAHAHRHRLMAHRLRRRHELGDGLDARDEDPVKA
jgi:hypothetical protein